MSLSEKYQSIIDDEKRIADKKLADFNETSFLRECGLSAYNIKPLDLSEKSRALVAEAIKLIKPNKWHSAKQNFDIKDVVYSSNTSCGQVSIELLDDLELKKTRYYGVGSIVRDASSVIKYQWKDGNVYLGAFKPIEAFTDTGFFSVYSKANSKARELIKEANTKREQLRPFLFGSQKNVLLEYSWRSEGYKSMIHVILFDDGYLFADCSRYDEIIIYGDKISNKYAGFLDETFSLDDWLIENIRRINKE